MTAAIIIRKNTESDITAGAAAEGRTAERAEKVGFRDVFRVPEFRALWTAQLASVAGDQLARVALTVLVYARTASALLAAVTFVASVIPMFVGGVTLAGLADRFPRRSVMIACDVLRCALVLLMIIPGVPVAALVVLLFTVTLISAPFLAARSALVADVLEGERYVIGQTITLMTSQFAQVLGFGAGGAIAGFVGIRTSLLADAATYAVSAVIVAAWVRRRPAPRAEAAPGIYMPGEGTPGEIAAAEIAIAEGTAAEVAVAGFAVAEGTAGDGARVPRGLICPAVSLVFGTPGLLLPMLFGWLSAFYNVPEGVAAPLARSMGGGAATVGVVLAAQVLGETFGMAIFGRLVPPAARRRWMGPLAVATCAVLVVFAALPGLGLALAVLIASGAFGGFQLAASAEFVAALPQRMRGTAFGLAQGGMSLGQGIVLIVAGAAADSFAPARVIAVTGAIGAVCAVAVATSWTRAREESRRRV